MLEFSSLYNEHALLVRAARLHCHRAKCPLISVCSLLVLLQGLGSTHGRWRPVRQDWASPVRQDCLLTCVPVGDQHTSDSITESWFLSNHMVWAHIANNQRQMHYSRVRVRVGHAFVLVYPWWTFGPSGCVRCHRNNVSTIYSVISLLSSAGLLFFQKGLS